MISDAPVSAGDRCRAAWAAAREFARSGWSRRGGWVPLQFRLAIAATAALSGRDAVMRELLTAGPPGQAVVRIAPRKPIVWVAVREGVLRWGRGESPTAADVEIIFRDEATAAAALRGQLDELAAVGRGDIVVRGLVPLAEMLGRVMDRLGVYCRRRGGLR
jgi:hypothetical protein